MIRILFFGYFIVELVCIMLYMSRYGFLNFLGEVFLSGIIGLSIIIAYGLKDTYSKVSNLNLKTMFGSMGIIFGALLLIVPGVLSDVLGLISLLVSSLLKVLSRAKEPSKGYQNDEIIDVEVIEERSK